LFLLAACSHQRPGCTAADWEADGRDHGRSAGGIDVGLAAMVERCSGAEQQEPAWRRGYALGMAEYCRPAGGWSAGRAGAGEEIARNCPATLRRNFLANWRLGRRMRQLYIEQDRLRRQLSSTTRAGQHTHLQNRLDRLEQELADLTAIARMRGYLPPPAAPDT